MNNVEKQKNIPENIPEIHKMNLEELKEQVENEKSSMRGFFAVFPHGDSKLYFYYDADRKKFMFPASPDEAMNAIPEVAPSHEVDESFFEELDAHGGHFEEIKWR